MLFAREKGVSVKTSTEDIEKLICIKSIENSQIQPDLQVKNQKQAAGTQKDCNR